MNRPSQRNKRPSTNVRRIILIISACILSLCTASLAVAQEEETEPKKLQLLYKCFDKEIFKLSKKKKRESVKKLMKKCDNHLEKWLVMLPEESRDVFMAQLEESINLALEDAKNGRFVADED